MKRATRRLIGALLSMTTLTLGAEPNPRPNILFIYLDDLGYGDISCFNPKSKIQTPNIDRIAAQGIVFTDAHTPAAICGPSRYGLLTGRYPWRKGKEGVENGPKYGGTRIEGGRLTLASLLKREGYNTAQIGKWGLRHQYSDAVKPGRKPGTRGAYDFPNKRLLGAERFGFDYSRCWVKLFPVAAASAHALENGLPVNPGLETEDMHRRLPDSAMKVVEYMEAYVGKRTNPAFHLNRQKPFLIYWDPPCPHEPIVPNKEFIGKSRAGAYGDFVVEIDHYIGVMLDTLETSGLADHTLVIFSSDNGPESFCYDRAKRYGHYSMGPLRGAKRDTWEGGHRLPLLVRWPGVIEPGRRSDQLLCLTDWFATFAEMTRQPLPEDAGEDSISFLPLLQGKSVQSGRKSVIHHTYKGQYAIRSGKWLYIDYKPGAANVEPAWFREERGVKPHDDPGELFNLEEDPQQTTNLYDKYPEKMKELKRLLEQQKAAGRTK